LSDTSGSWIIAPVETQIGRASVSGIGLVCPRDRQPLAAGADGLRCAAGHRYPVVGGIPVLLDNLLPDIHPYFEESRRAGLQATATTATAPVVGVDPFVQQEIVKTNGILYRGTEGGLTRYPIPKFPLADGGGRKLLDIGCNWGRWCVAASQAGFETVGIDPSLAAVQAAYRVSRQLGVAPEFVTADGRALPFPDASFDVVYSYSVLQHFSKEDARATIAEAARVVKPQGRVLIQMANLLGVRQLYNQLRDIIRGEDNVFRVRRWLPGELVSTFTELVGPASLTADGYFSLNAQPSDVDLLAPLPKAVVRTSEALKAVSRRVKSLALVADSVFIEARRG
jgi:2-polyprenyl-3-methyl-5-hydroxy-6-metoxy-1,4-benzoquinol methylase